MKKGFFILTFFLLFSHLSYSWNHQGHRLVALIARSQLDDKVIETINFYLKGMSWEDAACWMDDVHNDAKYEEMKTWHYVNIEKDKTYVQTKENNIINKLEYCLRMLEYRIYQPEDVVHETLKVLFHLVGDIHQPLHCGYSDDRGGNEVRLYLIQKETNLHKVWDREIIDNKNIDIWRCAKVLVGMNLSLKKKTEIEKIDILGWANESRILLPSLYITNGNKIDQHYLEVNTPIVESQLIKAGLRLAAILNRYFK
ncbi:S1/P1 nuclease [Aurantibacillus circumpalustris]|uniref:S1/P1 nuclease n=1 Tax=Aurantibacillus circumpalustris TaxID=3036359 RepID=UPI00295BE825|nr:S1/P1 nuclease [Aurantibacillus circumpalustris]